MDTHWSQLISGAIGFVTATIVGLIGYFGVLKQSGNQETEIVLTAWKELLAPLQIQLTEAKIEIAALRAEAQLRERNHIKETESLLQRIRELERLNQVRV